VTVGKKKSTVEIHSYGLYERWDRESRELPELIRITTEIEARLDVEFGYVLRIRNARNGKITFQIDHPPFMDSQGSPAAPFKGELYVKTNDFRFFLGDTVWEPIDDKRGEWRLQTWLDGEPVADKTLLLY
jgi:hypothetical protein